VTLKRKLIQLANQLLVPLRVEIQSRTAELCEQDRIRAAINRGDFGKPVYPLPQSFRSQSFVDVVADLPKYEERFATFRDRATNDVGFEYGNGFFSSPDAEVLYTLVRRHQPARIVEIGCGNSTRVIHQAILDGKIDCHHRCIDPAPRRDVSDSADEVIISPIEACDPHEVVSGLGKGDILFIDTSHELAPANDVAFIYGRLVPLVPAGVFIHIHDIFLPYEYPVEWVRDLHLNWSEQYLVQVMLMSDDSWEALWPGHYLERTLSDFDTHFPHRERRHAQSLWIVKKARGQ